ncbi:MAG: AMP-binding protein [Burkholderiales bacterium]|nr:AMP-binding protein [Burkholderiales bacterium]
MSTTRGMSTTAVPPPPNTVRAMLAERAAATPMALAFQAEATPGGGWHPVRWQDFADRVQRLARGLAAAGLRHGDRLALIAPNSLEWELLQHAALSLGAVVVGLDAHDLPERLATMCGIADVVAYATTNPALLARVDPERLASARFLLDLGTAVDGALPATPPRFTWASMDELATTASPPTSSPAADDIATIIFTSGTTGTPKGIPFSHRQVCLTTEAICEVFSFVPPDGRLLCWLPLSNLLQRMINFAALRRGATTYVLGDPRRVMEVVAGVEPDVFVGVPRFFEKLHEGIGAGIAAQPALPRLIAGWAWATGRRASALRLEGRALPPWLALAHAVADRWVLARMRRMMGRRLRCMVTGSAPTPPHLLQEFHALGWLVLEAYGLSENVLPMAMNRLDDFRFGTVGRPLPGNDIVVGEDGAIKVRGPGVFTGYLGDNTNPLDAQGYYTTGDLGRFDADGYLSLAGRSNELIKTSTGRRISPLGAEAQLRRVAGIDQVVVVGAGRKCLVALCTLQPGLQDSVDGRTRLVNALRERLAELGEHERPSGIALLSRPFTIEDGELTTNLKLRRSAIEARHAGLIEELYRAVDQAGTTDPRNAPVM